MDINEITSLVLNSGVTVAVVIYFMWRDSKFLTNLDRTLVTLVDTVQALKEVVENTRSNNNGI